MVQIGPGTTFKPHVIIIVSLVSGQSFSLQFHSNEPQSVWPVTHTLYKCFQNSSDTLMFGLLVDRLTDRLTDKLGFLWFLFVFSENFQIKDYLCYDVIGIWLDLISRTHCVCYSCHTYTELCLLMWQLWAIKGLTVQANLWRRKNTSIIFLSSAKFPFVLKAA